MSARLLPLFALGLFVTGCAHTLEVRSEPAGADVYVDGERVGETPMVLSQESGQEDLSTLSVRRQGREARFAVRQDAWSPEAVIAGVVGGAGTALAGGVLAGVGYVGFIGLLITSPELGAAALPLVIGAVGLLYGGILVAALAGYVPFFVAAEWGRIGPDEVFVDLRSGDVKTSPPGHASPLVGVTEGFVPASGRGARAEELGPRIPSREDPRPE